MEATTRPLSSAETAAAKQLLCEAPFAHLAVVEPAGPYVVPLSFAYVDESDGVEGQMHSGLGGRIYFHTGEGRKTEALAGDPRVCMAFTVHAAFEKGDNPCGDGFSYRSLLVWGRARKVDDTGRRKAALRAIVAKYDPAAAEVPFKDAVFARTLVYEVIIEAAGYKQEPPSPAG